MNAGINGNSKNDLLLTIGKLLAIMTVELTLVTAVYALVTKLTIDSGVQAIRLEFSQRYPMKEDVVSKTAYEIRHEELIKEDARLSTQMETIRHEVSGLRADVDRLMVKKSP